MKIHYKKIIFFLFVTFYTQSLLAEITFEEILEDPADLELNLKYAKEQEGLGRYKTTLSTLERLNMLYPVNTDLKLYLISILLKLDSAAKLQLMLETMMQDPNTTDETREYIEKTLATIKEQSEPKGRWFAFADVNYMQTDHSNIDGVSKTEKLFAQNVTGDMDGLKYDKSYSKGTSVTVGKNLDSTSAVSFNTGININTQNKNTSTALEGENDLAFGSLTYTKVRNKHFLMPYMFFSRPNQRNSTPADSLTKGIGFNNTYSLNNTTNITYGSSYSSTVFNVKANNREDNVTSGNNEIYSSNISYNYSFSDINLISLRASAVKKKALADFNAYVGHGLNIGYTRILPFGNLKIEKTYQQNIFDAKNSFIHSRVDRRDYIKTSQIQLSGRINQLVPFLEKIDPKSQLFFNFTYAKSDADSTILQNNAIRETASFNITKRFSLYE